MPVTYHCTIRTYEDRCSIDCLELSPQQPNYLRGSKNGLQVEYTVSTSTYVRYVRTVRTYKRLLLMNTRLIKLFNLRFQSVKRLAADIKVM